MSGEIPVQQPQKSRGPRAKPRKSAAAAVSDSDIANVKALQHNGHAKKLARGRGNQQANLTGNGVPAPAPAWQDSQPPQLQGTFDAHGNFISPQPFSDPQSAQFQPHPHQAKANSTSKRHVNNKIHGQSFQNGTVQRTPQVMSESDLTHSPATTYSSTPAKAAAYAGPTFHASPAASNLPIPKFFSKSMPNDPAEAGLQARLDQEQEDQGKGEASESSASPPTNESVPFVAVPERTNESPLDFLFKADKEQKAKRNSVGLTSTPPAKHFNGSIHSEPSRSHNWQSIYGASARNHARQPSNGSGNDTFMLELEGSQASPRSKPFSPPPPLPRFLGRSISDHSSMPALNVAQSSGARHSHGSAGQMPSHVSPPSIQPMMDHALSPFNRAPVHPTSRSAETTPPSTYQHGGHTDSRELHYGNRNLSPLFHAVKSDSGRRSSSLRKEVSHHGVVELPDNSPSRLPGHTHRVPSQANKAALTYLQSQVPNTSSMPQLQIPRVPSAETLELPATTTPTTKSADTKALEDDLKRMLKLASA